MPLLHFLNYVFVRGFGLVIERLSYPLIHRLGSFLGTCAFFLHRTYRKKAMSNLAIAFGSTHTERQRKKLACQSFQNIMITLLEFFRLKRSQRRIAELVTLIDNPAVEELLVNKQGVIFLTAHQANWEIPFIAITARFPGIAIGRPIKNRWLYRWVLSVRQMHGGKIVMPKKAIWHGIRALKEGKFLGIVGDQAFPESSYAYSLLGTRAWTAQTPAILAYKAKCPLVACATKRIGHRYEVTASPPYWPDFAKPMKDEVPALMDKALRYLETSIQERPGEWMWIHDRWKQQGIDFVKRKYRYGFILVILPQNLEHFRELFSIFRTIYHRSFLTFFVPESTELSAAEKALNLEIKTYNSEKDFFIRDWRYQLVFDFYNPPVVRRHFLKLGAFKVLSLADLQKKTPGQTELKQIIRHALVKPECLKDVIL